MSLSNLDPKYLALFDAVAQGKKGDGIQQAAQLASQGIRPTDALSQQAASDVASALSGQDAVSQQPVILPQVQAQAAAQQQIGQLAPDLTLGIPQPMPQTPTPSVPIPAMAPQVAQTPVDPLAAMRANQQDAQAKADAFTVNTDQQAADMAAYRQLLGQEPQLPQYQQPKADPWQRVAAMLVGQMAHNPRIAVEAMAWPEMKAKADAQAAYEKALQQYQLADQAFNQRLRGHQSLLGLDQDQINEQIRQQQMLQGRADRASTQLTAAEKAAQDARDREAKDGYLAWNRFLASRLKNGMIPSSDRDQILAERANIAKRFHLDPEDLYELPYDTPTVQQQSVTNTAAYRNNVLALRQGDQVERKRWHDIMDGFLNKNFDNKVAQELIKNDFDRQRLEIAWGHLGIAQQNANSYGAKGGAKTPKPTSQSIKLAGAISQLESIKAMEPEQADENDPTTESKEHLKWRLGMQKAQADLDKARGELSAAIGGKQAAQFEDDFRNGKVGPDQPAPATGSGDVTANVTPGVGGFAPVQISGPIGFGFDGPPAPGQTRQPNPQAKQKPKAKAKQVTSNGHTFTILK